VSGVTDGTNPADAAELTGLAAGKIAIAPLTNGSFRVDQLPEAAFENLLVVSLGTGPRRIEEAVREAGHEPKKVGVVPVSGTELSYDGPMWTSDRVGPNDLTGISIRVGQGLEYVKPGEGWVVLDSLTVLLMYNETDRVYRLVNSIASNVRNRNAHRVFTIVRDATSDDSYGQFRNLFDREMPL
jgi:hypothetical protein